MCTVASDTGIHRPHPDGFEQAAGRRSFAGGVVGRHHGSQSRWTKFSSRTPFSCRAGLAHLLGECRGFRPAAACAVEFACMDACRQYRANAVSCSASPAAWPVDGFWLRRRCLLSLHCAVSSNGSCVWLDAADYRKSALAGLQPCLHSRQGNRCVDATFACSRGPAQSANGCVISKRSGNAAPAFAQRCPRNRYAECTPGYSDGASGASCSKREVLPLRSQSNRQLSSAKNRGAPGWFPSTSGEGFHGVSFVSDSRPDRIAGRFWTGIRL